MAAQPTRFLSCRNILFLSRQSLVALDEFGSIHPTPQLYAFIFEVVGGIG